MARFALVLAWLLPGIAAAQYYPDPYPDVPEPALGSLIVVAVAWLVRARFRAR